METSEKKWTIVSVLLAGLVISLVTYKMLTKDPGTKHGEILTSSDKLQENATTISQEELMSKLHQMENRLNKNRFQENGLKNTSRSEDIELLQHQIDLLRQQVTELVTVIAKSGTYNSSGRKDDRGLLQSAMNDPGRRKHFGDF